MGGAGGDFFRGRKGEPLQEVRTSDEQRLSPESRNSELRSPADATARPPGYVRVASTVNGAGGYKYRLRQPRRHFCDCRPDHISFSLQQQQQSQLRPKSPPLSSFEREAIRTCGHPSSGRPPLRLPSSDWYRIWRTFHCMGDRKRKVVHRLEF